MAHAAQRRHHPRGKAALPGAAAPGQHAVIMRGFGKAHGDACTHTGGGAHQKGGPSILRGKGGGKDRRQGRNRSVHQPGQPRLHPGQDELPPRAQIFLVPFIAGKVFLLKVFGRFVMARLGGGQIPQQAARGGIAAGLRGAQVKGFGLGFHRGGFGADGLKAQVFHQPDRAAGIKARHMFAADQRNHLAKAAAMQVDQLLAVAIFLDGHAVEHCRRGRVIGAQALGIAAVDVPVILFGRDGEREDFLFRQIGKPAAGGKGGQHESTNLELF